MASRTYAIVQSIPVSKYWGVGVGMFLEGAVWGLFFFSEILRSLYLFQCVSADLHPIRPKTHRHTEKSSRKLLISHETHQSAKRRLIAHSHDTARSHTTRLTRRHTVHTNHELDTTVFKHQSGTPLFVFSEVEGEGGRRRPALPLRPAGAARRRRGSRGAPPHAPQERHSSGCCGPRGFAASASAAAFLLSEVWSTVNLIASAAALERR